MGFTGASSIVLALAVGLWLCYAVPSWRRRHNDVAIERNAVRLQRTIRALAETAEMPRELRVEATSRAVAEQRRALERAERSAPRRPEAAASPAASLRRARLLSTGVLLLGLAAAVCGAVSAQWWGVGAGVALVAAAVAMLEQSRRVAARRRARRSAAPRPAAAGQPVRAPQQLLRDDLVEAALEDAARTTAAPAQPSGWVPQPLPRPLYLDRDLEPGPEGGPGGGPDGGLPARRADPMAELLAAVRRSEQAIRAAHQEAGVATFGAIDAITLDSDEPVLRPLARAGARPAGRASRPAPAGEGSRWARMGLIEDVEPEFEDISEILRRRRAG